VAGVAELICSERPQWQVRAACRTASPDLFFPSVSQAGRYDRGAVAPALELCHQCPVRLECLQAALERGERHGIWGGKLFMSKPRHRATVTAG
jgi:hypothetical protein